MQASYLSRSSPLARSEEHTSELQSHGTISYAVFCLKKKKKQRTPGTEPWPGRRPGRASSIARHRAAASSAASGQFFFFFNDTATTEIYTVPYTLSLHDALPI